LGLGVDVGPFDVVVEEEVDGAVGEREADGVLDSGLF